jgi:DNA-binding GntR family transcriptional regulator
MIKASDHDRPDLDEGGPVTGSRAHAAYVETRRRIVELELTPDQTFTEGALAHALGMSKTPVREALVVLAAQGYVNSMPQSGYRITPVTLRDIRELFDNHILLAGAAVEAARFPRPAERFARLGQLFAERPPGNDPALADAFVASYLQFQFELAALCGNRRMRPLLARLLWHHERLIRMCVLHGTAPGPLVGDDGPLVRALLAGDWSAAREAARSRLAECRDRVLRVLGSTDEILDAAIQL